MAEGWLRPRELIYLADEELAQHDIAAVSLACARELPYADEMDVGRCVGTLDTWAGLIQERMPEVLRLRGNLPEYEELSENEYRIVALLSALYKHFGLVTNDDCTKPDYVYRGDDARNQFIHGALQHGWRVTCCTAPVIVAAIGRRLGYPTKLVKTRQHVFCRWDSPEERFNIEATDSSYFRYSDEYYKSWPKPIYEEAVKRGVFLQSLTPREELALFLNLRGTCFLWNLWPIAAEQSFDAAWHLDEKDYFVQKLWFQSKMIAHAEWTARQMYGEMHYDPSVLRSPDQYADSGCYEGACDLLNEIRDVRRKREKASVRDLVFEEFAGIEGDG